jgi:hypothetical protein
MTTIITDSSGPTDPTDPTDSLPITSTNLRPFTNNDATNDVTYRHGLPRPMKHYRLGSITAITLNPDSSDGSGRSYLKTNLNRYVRSSISVPFISLTMDRPGCVNKCDSNTTLACRLERDTRMDGRNVDCMEAEKARRRAMSTSTNLSKKYYQTQHQYRQARCRTISQNAYQYTHGGSGVYVANCSGCSETSGSCAEVIYKPSNAQYSQQGGVSSSSRTTRVVLNNINRGMVGYKNSATESNFVSATESNFVDRYGGTQLCLRR